MPKKLKVWQCRRGASLIAEVLDRSTGKEEEQLHSRLFRFGLGMAKKYLQEPIIPSWANSGDIPITPNRVHLSVNPTAVQTCSRRAIAGTARVRDGRMMAARFCGARVERKVAKYLSKMSEMMQAYISRPSGNCRATLLAPACFSLQTVLWICRNMQ